MLGLLPLLSPGLPPGGLLFLLLPGVVLDGHHDLGPLPAEPLTVQMLNEFGQRHLPRLLLVVVLFTEPPRVHAEFSGHLDLRVREPMPLAGVDPNLELVINAFLFGHAIHN